MFICSLACSISCHLQSQPLGCALAGHACWHLEQERHRVSLRTLRTQVAVGLALLRLVLTCKQRSRGRRSVALAVAAGTRGPDNIGAGMRARGLKALTGRTAAACRGVASGRRADVAGEACRWSGTSSAGRRVET